jgi:branched-subunit amino acid transport protein AzlD
MSCVVTVLLTAHCFRAKNPRPYLCLERWEDLDNLGPVGGGGSNILATNRTPVIQPLALTHRMACTSADRKNEHVTPEFKRSKAAFRYASTVASSSIARLNPFGIGAGRNNVYKFVHIFKKNLPLSIICVRQLMAVRKIIVYSMSHQYIRSYFAYTNELLLIYTKSTASVV